MGDAEDSFVSAQAFLDPNGAGESSDAGDTLFSGASGGGGGTFGSDVFDESDLAPGAPAHASEHELEQSAPAFLWDIAVPPLQSPGVLGGRDAGVAGSSAAMDNGDRADAAGECDAGAAPVPVDAQGGRCAPDFAAAGDARADSGDEGVADDEDREFHTPLPGSRCTSKSPAHIDSQLRTAVLAVGRPTRSARVADPFDPSGAAQIVAFGAAPLSTEEAKLLRRLADGSDRGPAGAGPLAAIVRRLFDTIRFQREELDSVKRAEVQLTDRAIDEERRRHSVLERRRSLVVNKLTDRMRALQEEVDELREEHAQCALHSSASAEYVDKLEAELEASDAARAGFLRLAKRCSPDIVDGSEPLAILEAVDSFVAGAMPSGGQPSLKSVHDESSVSTSGAEAPAADGRGPVALDEYGERLLELERVLKASEDRCERLLQEKTDLQVRLVGLEGRPSLPATPGSLPAESPSRAADEASVHERLHESQENVLSLRAQVDKLRDVVTRLQDERKAMDESVLDMRLKLDSSRAKVEDASNARGVALEGQKRIAAEFAALTAKYQKMSKELTENTVQAVQELQDREAACSILEEQVADRDRAIAVHITDTAQLSATILHLERELLQSSSQLAQKSRLAGSAATAAAKPILCPPSKEEAGALHAALLQKTTAMEVAREERTVLVERMNSLEGECTHWRDLALSGGGRVDRGPTAGEGAVRQLTPDGRGQQGELEDGFLRRLSARLGCHGSTSRELVTKLVERVEHLMAERRTFETTIARLQAQIVARERSMHLMRSEFSAEISALKSELAHVENDRVRAVADREAAEVRFLEAAKRDGGSVSSVADDDTQRTLLGLGMDASRGPGVDVDDSTLWDDPSIQAAVQSLNVLIGSKAALDARNKALKDKLNRCIQTGSIDSAAASRALAIESRSLNEELVGIVSLQQKVIQKLRSATPPRDSLRPAATSDSPDARGAAKSSPARAAPASGPPLAAKQASLADRRRQSLAEAADFLREQLNDMRALCDERARSNASLHGVVREMEAEAERIAGAREDAERKLAELADANAGWLNRLAEVAGVAASAESVELFVCDAVACMSAHDVSLKRVEDRSLQFESRLGSALAQKRVLSHIIHLYQDKYQLDMLGADPGQPRSGLAKLRRAVTAIFAVSRAQRAAHARCPSDGAGRSAQPVFVNLSSRFDLPDAVSLVRATDAIRVPLESAALALRAIPKLEAALEARDGDIARLRASLGALEVPDIRPLADVGENAQPEAFDYKDDVVERKNDLARRLRKALKQREELSLRLVREKRERQALEVRVGKYMDKLSSYQRRLGRAKNEADARDRTYKAAIRYLKSKADNAVQGEGESDFCATDTNALLWEDGGGAGREIEPPPAEAAEGRRGRMKPAGRAGDASDIPSRGDRATLLLEQQIRIAREELSTCAAGGEKARELESYVSGLEKAAAQLRRTVALAASGVESGGRRV
jgi:hypothetical protein